MSSFYLRIAAYAVAAIVLAGIGYKIGAHRWESKYQALQAENWKGMADREATARKALEQRLKDAQTVSANNAQVIHDLQNTTAAIAADRDHSNELIHRMLASAARRPTSPVVPEATGESGTAPAGETSGNGRLEQLLGDAAAECKGNAAQLNSLIAEIKPQL